MKISEIYQKFITPPNLKNHLLLVTKVALHIVENWQGLPIDVNKLKTAALLHDLANIVKFDFAKHPEFLGSEQSRINYWIAQQKEVVNKYGNDDHVATEKMLTEIGVPEEIIDIIDLKSFGSAVEVNDSNNWEVKILLYSDLRVGPFGIISLRERIDDLVGRLEKYKNRSDLPQLTAACKNIEDQIRQYSGLNLEKLKIEDLNHDDKRLLDTDI